MKKFYIIALAIGILSNIGIQKDLWGQLVSKYAPGMPKISYFINSQNGGYYGLGHIQNGVVLIRFNDNMNVLWSKSIVDSVMGSFTFFKQEGNSNLIMGGASYLEVDSSGNLIKQFTINGNLYLKDATYSQHNSLYLFGSLLDSIGVFDIGILKLDSSGNNLWSIKNLPHYSRFMVTSFAYHDSILMISNNPDGSDCNLQMEVIGPNGEWNIRKKWALWMAATLDPSFTKMPSGYYLLTGMAANINSQIHTYLCILDEFTIVKQKSYAFQFTSGHASLYNIKSVGLANGSMICAGNINSQLSSVCIFKTDSNLNIEWCYIVEDSTNADLRSLVSTTDGGFIINVEKAGVTEFIRFDSLGNTACPKRVLNYQTLATPIEYPVGGVSKTSNLLTMGAINSVVSSNSYNLNDYCIGTNVSESNSNEEIKIFSDPSSNKISVSGFNQISGTIKVFNMKGNMILLRNIEDPIIYIDMQFCAAGIYLLSVVNENSVISKKFIKF